MPSPRNERNFPFEIASWCGLPWWNSLVLVCSYCYKPILLPKVVNIEQPSEISQPSVPQAHEAMPQTKFIHFNKTCTKTSSADLHQSQEHEHPLAKLGWSTPWWRRWKKSALTRVQIPTPSMFLWLVTFLPENKWERTNAAEVQAENIRPSTTLSGG